MREVIVVYLDGKEKKIDVRGLTPNELKKLKADGHRFAPEYVDPSDQKARDAAEEKAGELLDIVFEKVLDPGDINSLGDAENKYTKKIFRACMKETFGDPDEEKNL